MLRIVTLVVTNQASQRHNVEEKLIPDNQRGERKPILHILDSIHDAIKEESVTFFLPVKLPRVIQLTASRSPGLSHRSTPLGNSLAADLRFFLQMFWYLCLTPSHTPLTQQQSGKSRVPSDNSIFSCKNLKMQASSTGSACVLYTTPTLRRSEVYWISIVEARRTKRKMTCWLIITLTVIVTNRSSLQILDAAFEAKKIQMPCWPELKGFLKNLIFKRSSQDTG